MVSGVLCVTGGWLCRRMDESAQSCSSNAPRLRGNALILNACRTVKDNFDMQVLDIFKPRVTE